GEFRAALEALRAGDEMGSRRKDWDYPSAQLVKRCERFLELDGRLPAILKGEARPSGDAECLELALLCRYKGLYPASVRCYPQAFAANAKLADSFWAGHRYRAACSAAQARLRRQALDWLRADLAWASGRLEGGTPLDRAGLDATLRRWQTDPALAGVREA